MQAPPAPGEPCRRAGALRRALATAITLLAIALPPLASAGGLAHGLIVRLKDTSRATALAAGSIDRIGSASADGPALAAAQRTVREARLRTITQVLGVPARSLRPVGADAHLVDLGRPLRPDEAESLARALRAQPDVDWVVPNERERRLGTPNDPLFAAGAGSTGQWWLFPAGGSNGNVLVDRRRGVPGFQTAWDTSTGSAAAVVAILDTGVTAHPDLSARLLPGYDMVSTVEYAGDGDGRDPDPSDPGDYVSAADKLGAPLLFGNCDVSDSSWHGTTTAAIVGAVTNNNAGVAGASWAAGIVPVRVAGKCGAEVADIVDGMRWAAGLQVLDAQGHPLPLNTHPARIVNISFGGSGACNDAYQAAIDELARAGVVVVAAAGNNSSTISRPASCRGVIGVVALNRDGFKASYSNFGAEASIATVGGDPTNEGAWGAILGDDGLLTLGNSGRAGPDQPAIVGAYGSSFAAPVVSATLSLMLSVNPGLSAAQLAAGLRTSARPHVVSPVIGSCSAANPGRCICTTQTCGAGILDVTRALAYAASPDSYVATPLQPGDIDNAETTRAAALGADMPPTTAPPAGGSGGGAVGPVSCVALALALLALTRSRARHQRRA